MEGETIQDLLSKRYSDRLIPNTVIHLTEGAIGIFGNIIVLVMYSRYIADKNGTRYFIPVLAVVDLMGCLSNVVQFQLDNTMRYTYPDVHLCKTLFFFYDNVWWTLRSSYFRYFSAEILDDLPSVWSADDTKVLQARFCDFCSFLVRICRSCVKVWRI